VPFERIFSVFGASRRRRRVRTEKYLVRQRTRIARDNPRRGSADCIFNASHALERAAVGYFPTARKEGERQREDGRASNCADVRASTTTVVLLARKGYPEGTRPIREGGRETSPRALRSSRASTLARQARFSRLGTFPPPPCTDRCRRKLGSLHLFPAIITASARQFARRVRVVATTIPLLVRSTRIAARCFRQRVTKGNGKIDGIKRHFCSKLEFQHSQIYLASDIFTN